MVLLHVCLCMFNCLPVNKIYDEPLVGFQLHSLKVIIDYTPTSGKFLELILFKVATTVRPLLNEHGSTLFSSGVFGSAQVCVSPSVCPLLCGHDNG